MTTSDAKNCNRLPLLICPKCGHEFSIGQDAQLITDEDVLQALVDSGVKQVVFRGLPARRPDLAQHAELDPQRRVRNFEKAVEVAQSLRRGEYRRWYCGHCKETNDYPSSWQTGSTEELPPSGPHTAEPVARYTLTKIRPPTPITTDLRPNSCDLCASHIELPQAFVLDVQAPPANQESYIHAVMGIFSQGDVPYAILEKRYYVVCEDCLTNLHTKHGEISDPLKKEMARNRASYLWSFGKWETPMLPHEFPACSEERLLPWLNETAEKTWLRQVGDPAPEEEYVTMRSVCLSILLKVDTSVSVHCTQNVETPSKFVALVAELPSAFSPQEFAAGFAARRLLDSMGMSTRFCLLPYDLPTWFSFRMTPYVAAAVAHYLGETAESQTCYVDDEQHHLLVIKGQDA